MTTASGQGSAGLRIGVVPGVTLGKWRTIWRQRYPRVPLTVVELQVDDQRRALVVGDVDACFVRLPLETDGLHVIRLYDDVSVVWVSPEHPLAAFDDVSEADLASERVLERVDPAALERVARAEAVLRVPMSVARSHSRRDLVYRPVTDAPATTVALAWPVDGNNEAVADFVGVVRGRTENSSRTAQDRAAGSRDDPPSRRRRRSRRS